MQDLVGVGVADAAEQVRIGERALERMVLALHAVGELLETGREDVEPAGIHRGERGLALDQMDRGAALRSGLREDEHPVSKAEGREGDPPGELRVGADPAQPASDHEMQNEEKLTLERDDDALADSPDADDFPSLGGCDRRRHAAQHEGIHEPHALERPPDEAAFQMLDIDDDVGQLRHRGSFT